MSPVDQHVPLREQRHRALVDAARALATEHGAAGFTVDRVATLAGVSRRTSLFGVLLADSAVLTWVPMSLPKASIMALSWSLPALYKTIFSLVVSLIMGEMMRYKVENHCGALIMYVL